MAGKIVKRGIVSTLSSSRLSSYRGPNLGDQSSISRIQTIPIAEQNNDNSDELEVKQAYPTGAMLLREEEIQNSMMADSQQTIGNKRRSDPGGYPVAVPLQKRVDHMMMREKEKQERLENLR